MPILSLRISDEELNDLSNLALQNHNTTSEYAKTILFPNIITNDNLLTHNDVLTKISSNLNSGDTFSIPELFSKQEWQGFTNTISIGRTFRISSKNQNSIVSNAVDFVEKKSGHPAVYRKK